MNARTDLSLIKQIPIIAVANRLGIQVRGTKAMCFMGHDKASPSLSFRKTNNTWRCFGACGKHGDEIALVMEKEGLDFKGALEWFSSNFAVDVRPFRSHVQPRRMRRSKKPVVPTNPSSEQQEFLPDPELYEWLIEKCGKVSHPTGLKYLNAHGISAEAATRFNVRELRDPARALQSLLGKWGARRVYSSGLAWGLNGHLERMIWSTYALLFPCYERGIVTCIQARMFEGHPKFLNPRGIPKPMFNMDRVRALKAGQLVHLCEGAPDAVALESHGLAAIGILGASSFHPEWVNHFMTFKVVILGDGDPAGEKFTKDISGYFRERGKPVNCMALPKGQDVSDVLAEAERAG